MIRCQPARSFVDWSRSACLLCCSCADSDGCTDGLDVLNKVGSSGLSPRSRTSAVKVRHLHNSQHKLVAFQKD